jgi:hypothetical protein
MKLGSNNHVPMSESVTFAEFILRKCEGYECDSCSSVEDVLHIDIKIGQYRTDSNRCYLCRCAMERCLMRVSYGDPPDISDLSRLSLQ